MLKIYFKYFKSNTVWYRNTYTCARNNLRQIELPVVFCIKSWPSEDVGDDEENDFLLRKPPVKKYGRRAREYSWLCRRPYAWINTRKLPELTSITVVVSYVTWIFLYFEVLILLIRWHNNIASCKLNFRYNWYT